MFDPVAEWYLTCDRDLSVSVLSGSRSMRASRSVPSGLVEGCRCMWKAVKVLGMPGVNTLECGCLGWRMVALFSEILRSSDVWQGNSVLSAVS